jgi:ferredoxin
MKITILSFSLTGNTKLAAKRIGEKLTEGNQHTVEHINLVKLNKEIDSLGIDSSTRLKDARTSIQSSDVVALAGFSKGFHPSWAIDQLFADAILPSSLFTNMKYCFVFATAGQFFGRTINILATLLSNKNSSAKFLGSIGLIAPDNYTPVLPERPFRDAWSPSQLTAADNFGSQIARYLNGSDPLPTAKVSNSASWRFFMAKKPLRGRLMPYPECNREKCQQCGTCMRKCPYNAIRVSPDIEDGFPVFDYDKCEGCGRCFNTCPAEAIEMPKANTATRSRYPKANTVPPGEKCPDGMISQAIPSRWELVKRQNIGKQGRSWFVPVLIVLIVAIVIAFFWIGT